MNDRQVNACCKRLPEPQRTRFLELMGGASALFRRAVEMNREAWALYRETTGATVKGKKTK